MSVFVRDIETRSTVDLKKVGIHVYATHPTTEVLCVAYCMDNKDPKVWVPGMPVPQEYISAAKNGSLAVAHNVTFELGIERHILGPKFKFPIIPVKKNFCTQIAACAMALPPELGKCLAALNLQYQKDVVGRRTMLQVTKPRKPKKGEDPNAVLWHDDVERLERVHQYCINDVLSERDLYRRLAPLLPDEFNLWLLDHKINERGFYVDHELLVAAKAVAEQGNEVLNEEMVNITKGAVTAFTEVARLQKWLRTQKIETDTLDKEDIELLLSRPQKPAVKRALELRLMGAQAAAKKIDAMLQRRQADGRVRGALLFHKAGTGRWCVDADTQIDTPNGPRRIVELHPGDLVIGGSGHPRKVLAKLYKGRETMYRLSGPNGAFVLATAGHRILTTQGWRRLDDCFQKMASGRFVLRKSCTPISNTTDNNRRDCKETRLQLADTKQGLKTYHTSGRISSVKTSSLLSQQDRAQEPNVRCAGSSRTNHATWLSRGVEWERLHSGAPAHIDEGMGALCLAERVGSTPHRWRQDQQQSGQLSNRNPTRASTSTQKETWKLVPVGERDVWDISVEKDESYVAQGLIHHNSSQGVQAHNMKRLPDDFDVNAAITVIKKKSYREALKTYPNPLEVIGTLSRPMIRSAPKKMLWGADFSGIEARVTAWLAGEESKLEIFRAYDAGTGPDPYIVTAADILRKPVAEITKMERQKYGKPPELAFGFQGGLNAFKKFSSDFTDEEIEEFKKIWRDKHPNIAKLWYNLNDQTRECVRTGHDQGLGFGKLLISYHKQAKCGLPIMTITLPSGRDIVYPDARIYTPQDGKPELRTRGLHFMDNTQGQWKRVRVYGGLITENVVQGVARDLLAHVMMSLDKAGFEIVLHVHDEVVLEEPVGSKRFDQFKKLMNQMPEWALGLPVVAKAWQDERYVK